MIKVLIADDHEIVRRGLADIFDEEPGMETSGEACNAEEVLPLLQEVAVDVVLLDINMPGRSGIEILKDLKSIYPRLHIIVLSMHPVEQYALRAIKAGADGYLTKETAPYKIVEAVRTVYAGKKYITPEVAEQLAQSLIGDWVELPHKKLSDREYEIMLLIAEGKTPKEISGKIHISTKTVSTYRNRIFTKMSLHSSADLVRYVVAHELKM
jgi:two-component system, NarL family, invasion response regulator UvrY